ncbi:uncharacterized protein K441DRAFT_576905, partial [Cenococcum geophilum 1.58]|uniref:uncharacterized protein n=1 Tax=Cenococcum geophilum 1.58 TaxID=794803 RepID=UPI00358EBB21
RYIYNTIVNYYRQIKLGLGPPLLRININREAGTGKSHLITILSTTLCDIARANTAPTRVAIFSINGRTIYNLLRLPVNRSFKKLPTTSLTPL